VPPSKSKTSLSGVEAVFEIFDFLGQRSVTLRQFGVFAALGQHLLLQMPNLGPPAFTHPERVLQGAEQQHKSKGNYAHVDLL